MFLFTDTWQILVALKTTYIEKVGFKMNWTISKIEPSELEQAIYVANLTSGLKAHYELLGGIAQVVEIEDHGECIYTNYSLAEIDDLETAITEFIAPDDK